VVDSRGAAGAEDGIQAPPPSAGCALGYGWVLGPPIERCGPPGPSSVAPHPHRPGLDCGNDLPSPCRGAG
jgi:hypothetical protein